MQSSFLENNLLNLFTFYDKIIATYVRNEAFGNICLPGTVVLR